MILVLLVLAIALKVCGNLSRQIKEVEMGDQNTGGGGSVLWRIAARKPVQDLERVLKAKQVMALNSQIEDKREIVLSTKYTRVSRAGQRYVMEGADDGASIGQNFTVTVKFSDLKKFKRSFRWDDEAKTLTFKVPIERDPSQIHIHWPDNTKE